MDKSGGLQGMAETFFSQVGGGKLPEFSIDQWCELIKGFLIALCPFGQQQCHFVRVGHSFRADNTGLSCTRNYIPPSTRQPCTSRHLWNQPAM